MSIEEALKCSERYWQISEKVFGYVNSRRIKQIKKHIEENNLDNTHIIIGRKKKQKIYVEGNCENCGKKHDGTRGSGRFCSIKCSHSFGAKLNIEDRNKKISLSLKNRNLGHPRIIEIICLWCGRKIEVAWRKRNQKTCSRSCSVHYRYSKIEERIKTSKKAKELLKSGKIKSWFTRNKLIPSYPEQFFIRVLDNNGLKYQREVKIGKYFADFLIGNLVLEIDGKQHEYEERKIKDREKDKYLISNGYEVYRIKWKNPVTLDNKKYISIEIEKLLEIIKCNIAP